MDPNRSMIFFCPKAPENLAPCYSNARLTRGQKSTGLEYMCGIYFGIDLWSSHTC